MIASLVRRPCSVTRWMAFPIHLPLTGEDLTNANLDECGGHSTPELGYHYHANDSSKNSVLTCLKGGACDDERLHKAAVLETVKVHPTAARQITASGGKKLGITVHELEHALGQSPDGDLHYGRRDPGYLAADLEAAMPQRPAGANGAPTVK